MKESTGDGEVLRHSRDIRLGDLHMYIPEYNLKDMTSTSEHFLNIFEFRALTPLLNQLYEGTNGIPGDREVMEETGMLYAHASREEKTVFLDGEFYGLHLLPGKNAGGVFPDIPFGSAASLVMPRAIGQFILFRQEFLFQYLNHIVEEILDLGSETRKKIAPEKDVNQAFVTAISNLKIQPKSLTSSLPQVRAHALESKTALEDHLHLLRSEPVVLNQAVKTAYWSRSELVPNDKGRILPVMTDRHLSAAFFESLTTAVKSIAIWDYILHLLELLDNMSDKINRGIVL